MFAGVRVLKLCPPLWKRPDLVPAPHQLVCFPKAKIHFRELRGAQGMVAELKMEVGVEVYRSHQEIEPPHFPPEALQWVLEILRTAGKHNSATLSSYFFIGFTC